MDMKLATRIEIFGIKAKTRESKLSGEVFHVRFTVIIFTLFVII